jgi:hypothetical protein
MTGTCPNCQAPIKVLKNETPTICYNCGSIVQAKDGDIYLTNPKNIKNNIYGGTPNGDDLIPMNQNVFTTFIEEITTVFTSNNNDEMDEYNEDGSPYIRQRPPPSSSSSSKQKRNTNTIIDVDVIKED